MCKLFNISFRPKKEETVFEIWTEKRGQGSDKRKNVFVIKCVDDTSHASLTQSRDRVTSNPIDSFSLAPSNYNVVEHVKCSHKLSRQMTAPDSVAQKSVQICFRERKKENERE